MFFIPEANEKPLTFYHHLKLHPWLAHRVQTIPVAPLPPPTTSTTAEGGEPAMDVDQPDQPAPSTATPVAALVAGTNDQNGQEPVEKNEPNKSSDTDVVGSAEGTPKATDAEPSSEAGTDSAPMIPQTEIQQPSETTTAAATAAPTDSSAPVSVSAGQSTLPATTNALRPAVDAPAVVHSWQYEEIVFPEPTEAFYEILVAHPPTP